MIRITQHVERMPYRLDGIVRSAGPAQKARFDLSKIFRNFRLDMTSNNANTYKYIKYFDIGYTISFILKLVLSTPSNSLWYTRNICVGKHILTRLFFMAQKEIAVSSNIFNWY